MSRLLGILDGLFSILAEVFGVIVDIVFKPVLNLILVPVIRILVELFKFIFGLLFYNVGKFLLALIDFVNNLFRVLCGLESNVMTMSLGENGGTGDILVQVIRSSEIQQAFISMCVVGLFLLLITSVFQIIKTEYTTEGAKNSKTPILQKAFKSLANLMLLPLLVVFGILIANGVLGILDRATSAEGENPTVSGLLFVTAASEAHKTASTEDITLKSDNLIDNLGFVLEKAVASAIDAVSSGKDSFEVDHNYINDENTRADIEENFINQREDYKYFKAEDMCKYYAFTEINYLLLILGGVIILKCFFFTCFGLIIRLYKCAVLFIISPVVIGMTPINEGGLGKWRTSFIGQVLSAYGTVLSINIFMIVVRVLINIELKITAEDGFLFPDSFMTFLLKSIIVIAGCLMIEKFSKEIGGYFGAEDAMGAGAGMAKEVGSTAMKAVGTVAAVGVGGAALAGGAMRMVGGAVKGGVKAVGGIANGIANKATGGGAKAGREAYKEARAQGASKEQAKEAKKAAFDAQKEKTAQAKQQHKDLKAERKEAGFKTRGGYIKHLKSQAYGEKQEQQKSAAEATSHTSKAQEYEAMAKKASGGERKQLRAKAQREREQAAKFTKEAERHSSNASAMEDRAATVQKDIKDKPMILKPVGSAIGTGLNKAGGWVGRRVLNAQSMGMGVMNDLASHAPWQKYTSKIQKMQESGAKSLGDDHVASLESEKKWVEDQKQKNLTVGPVTKAATHMVRNTAIMNTSQQFVKDLKFESSNLERQLASTFEKALKQYRSKDFQENYSDSDKAQWRSNLSKELGGYGSKLSSDELKSILDNTSITSSQQVDFKFDFDVKAIQEAVNKAIMEGGSNEALQRNLIAAMQKQTQAGNTQIVKKMEELLKKLQSELGGK